ncbi:unnamed protein product [Dovyalis caffra]|uniref:Uncharacterized protein n=1 Tax=Dovyalis caffra TaxID=77055 RepID=A0AAV1SKP9_9ROSI|nr:unnamed protein product [Dovyalis caffra]
MPMDSSIETELVEAQDQLHKIAHLIEANSRKKSKNDVEDLFILRKGNTVYDTVDQSSQGTDIAYANQLAKSSNVDWCMPNLKTYLPAYTLVQQEAIKKNLNYLEEEFEEVHRHDNENSLTHSRAGTMESLKPVLFVKGMTAP